MIFEMSGLSPASKLAYKFVQRSAFLMQRWHGASLPVDALVRRVLGRSSARSTHLVLLEQMQLKSYQGRVEKSRYTCKSFEIMRIPNTAHAGVAQRNTESQVRVWFCCVSRSAGASHTGLIWPVASLRRSLHMFGGQRSSRWRMLISLNRIIISI